MVLTGDVHRNLAANLKRNFDEPESATIGSELATTSISSGRNGADMDELDGDFLQANQPIYTRASFAVESGKPGLQQVGENPPQGKRYTPQAVTPDYLLETGDVQRSPWPRRCAGRSERG